MSARSGLTKLLCLPVRLLLTSDCSCAAFAGVQRLSAYLFGRPNNDGNLLDVVHFPTFGYINSSLSH